MTKLSKIIFGIWAALAIISFIYAFWLPIIPKIIGIAFGALNVMTLLTLVISYFQGLYYSNKIKKEFGDGLRMQESEETTEEERRE